MTTNDFIWKIEHGDDVMFDVRGHHYVIFTWDDEGIRIVERNTGAEGQYFHTAEELIDGFLVDGIKLRDVVEEVKITAYTLVKE